VFPQQYYAGIGDLAWFPAMVFVVDDDGLNARIPYGREARRSLRSSADLAPESNL
jgi:hypothetical protein